MNNNADNHKTTKVDNEELSIIEELSSLGELDLDIEKQDSIDKPDEISDDDFEDMDLLDDFDIDLSEGGITENESGRSNDKPESLDEDFLSESIDVQDDSSSFEDTTTSTTETPASNKPDEIKDDAFETDLESNLNAGFDDDLNAGFDDNLNAGFDDDLNAGFDDDTSAAFDDDLNAGFDDDLNAGFDDDLNAGFDDDQITNATSKKSAQSSTSEEDLFGEIDVFGTEDNGLESDSTFDNQSEFNDNEWGEEQFEDNGFMGDVDSFNENSEPENQTNKIDNIEPPEIDSDENNINENNKKSAGEAVKKANAFTNVTSQIMSDDKKEEKPSRENKKKVNKKEKITSSGGSKTGSIIVSSLISSILTGGAVIYGMPYISPSNNVTMDDVNNAIAAERNIVNSKINKVKQDIEKQSSGSSVAGLVTELESMRVKLNGIESNFDSYNSKLGHLGDLVEETQTSYKTLTAQRLGDLNDISSRIDKISAYSQKESGSGSVDEKSIKAIFALKSKIDQISKQSNEKLKNLELIINKSNSDNKLELLKAKEQLRAELEIVKKISEKTDLSIKAMKASVATGKDLNKTQMALGLDTGLNIVKAETRKNYKIRGFSNNKVFVEIINESGKQKIIPFTVNDYLDGYGKITRIDATTRTIMTESGIVKIN